MDAPNDPAANPAPTPGATSAPAGPDAAAPSDGPAALDGKPYAPEPPGYCPLPEEDRCRARSKQNEGRRCKNRRAEGKQVCWIHGGSTPAGAKSVHFRHGARGRLVRAIPAKYREQFERSLRSPELYSQRPQLALLDARLVELLERMDGGDSFASWQELRMLAGEVRAGGERLKAALPRMLGVIQRGASEAQRWTDVFGVLEQQRRTAESERRRIDSEREYVTLEDFLTFVALVTTAVRENVSSPAEREAISSRIIHYLPAGSPAGAEEAEEIVDAEVLAP